MVAVAGALAVGAGCRTANQSWEAEKTLHAFALVCDVISSYLRLSGGRWPTGWEELAAAVPVERGTFSNVFRWPDDLDELRKRVAVDFTLTTADVAAMDEAHFSAVEVVPPALGPYSPAVTNLLRAARALSQRSE